MAAIRRLPFAVGLIGSRQPFKFHPQNSEKSFQVLGNSPVGGTQRIVTTKQSAFAVWGLISKECGKTAEPSRRQFYRLLDLHGLGHIRTAAPQPDKGGLEPDWI